MAKLLEASSPEEMDRLVAWHRRRQDVHDEYMRSAVKSYEDTSREALECDGCGETRDVERIEAPRALEGEWIEVSGEPSGWRVRTPLLLDGWSLTSCPGCWAKFYGPEPTHVLALVLRSSGSLGAEWVQKPACEGKTESSSWGRFAVSPHGSWPRCELYPRCFPPARIADRCAPPVERFFDEPIARDLGKCWPSPPHPVLVGWSNTRGGKIQNPPE